MKIENEDKVKVCIICKEKLLPTSNVLSCDNKKCLRYGVLTVGYIENIIKKTPSQIVEDVIKKNTIVFTEKDNNTKKNYTFLDLFKRSKNE